MNILRTISLNLDMTTSHRDKGGSRITFNHMTVSMVFNRIFGDRARAIFRASDADYGNILKQLYESAGPNPQNHVTEVRTHMGNVMLKGFVVNNTGEVDVDWKAWLTVIVAEWRYYSQSQHFHDLVSLGMFENMIAYLTNAPLRNARQAHFLPRSS